MKDGAFDNPEMLDKIVRRICAAGASDAEVRTEFGAFRRAEARNGAGNGVTSAERCALHLTAYFGQRVATVTSNRLDADAIASLVDRVVAMARMAPESRYAGLPEAGCTTSGNDAHLALLDPATHSPETLETLALAIDAAALDGLRNGISEGCVASWSMSAGHHLTSRGLVRHRQGSRYGLSGRAVAMRGDEKQSASVVRHARWLEDLPDAAAIGLDLAQAAANKLGARKIASKRAAVIFDQAVAPRFLEPLLAAIDGHAIAQKRSFLADRQDMQILSPTIDLIDDPFIVRGLASAGADSEGILPVRRRIIAQGILTGWLLDISAARQLRLASTGHAGGPYNLSVTPGAHDRAGLMRQAGRGLIVTEMFSPSLNMNNGDWSVGVVGQWFEADEIAHPVQEVTVGGNLTDLYPEMLCGDDVRTHGSWRLPSLLVPMMTIAGR